VRNAFSDSGVGVLELIIVTDELVDFVEKPVYAGFVFVLGFIPALVERVFAFVRKLFPPSLPFLPIVPEITPPVISL
jgi:hypothetical protein